MRLVILPWLLITFNIARAQEISGTVLRDKIQPLVEKHRGTVGVSVRHLDTGERLEILGNERFPTASVIKIPIMVEAFARTANREIMLEELLTLQRGDKVHGSGILHSLSDGGQYRWKDLVTLSIVLSDNTATNMLLDRLGINAVNERMASIGLKNTLLFQKVFSDKFEAHPELARIYGLGMTTPNEMATLLERLANGQVVSAKFSNEMLAILKAQQNTNMLPRFLPRRNDVEIAHKTGAMNTVRNDVGVVFTPKAKWVICVMTKDNRDTSWGCENAAEILIGRISKVVFDHFQ